MISDHASPGSSRSAISKSSSNSSVSSGLFADTAGTGLSGGLRRGRNAARKKRARCRSAVPDVGDGDNAGCDGPLTPSAQRGPERRPVCCAAEALRGAAASSWERAPAPEACRGGRGHIDRRFGTVALIRCFDAGAEVGHSSSKSAGGSSPSPRRPAAASLRHCSPISDRGPGGDGGSPPAVK